MSLDIGPSGEAIAGAGFAECSILDVNAGTHGFQMKFDHDQKGNSYLVNFMNSCSLILYLNLRIISFRYHMKRIITVLLTLFSSL